MDITENLCYMKGKINSMERKIAFIFLTLSVFISALSIAYTLKNSEEEAKSVISDETSVGTSAPESEASGYVLKEFDGKLAVFEAGNDIPCKEFDVPVRLFSALDRKNLKEGIYASGEEEIKRLVEDYTS